MRRSLGWAGVMMLALGGAGCQPPQQTYYTGPTASLAEVVARVNANNSLIPSLWARQDFDGTIVDDKHESHAVSAHGVILYLAPHDLLIRANGDFQTPIFEIGANEQFYWLKVVPQMDTLWWGRMARAAKAAGSAIPVRPDLILDVLAMGQIDPNLNHEPSPVMRFNNDLDVYMVDSIVRGSDRMLIQKEIWYDRRTLEPRTVLLFDENGRVALRAHLSNFISLAAPGSPRIATVYNLLFPETGSEMKFTFYDAVLSKNGLPRAGGIRLPNLDNPGVKDVIDVDQSASEPVR